MTGVDVLFSNFIDNIFDGVLNATAAVCYIFGVIYVVRGLYDLWERAMGRSDPQRSPASTMMGIVVAGLLLSFAAFVEAWTGTIFGSSNDTFTYATASLASGTPATVTTTVNAGLRAVFRAAQLIGVMSIAEGVFILVALARGVQQKSMRESVTHMIAGACLFNGSTLVKALDATLQTFVFT